MNECSAYVGLDVYKDTIATAAEPPRRFAPTGDRKPWKSVIGIRLE